MRTIALTLVVVLALGVAFASTAVAEQSQDVDVLIGTILERYSISTNFGNVYFSIRHTRRLVDAAAKLRPLNLGNFETDQGVNVRVKAVKFDRGMVTLLISPK
jgi:hypothetical protein